MSRPVLLEGKSLFLDHPEDLDKSELFDNLQPSLQLQTRDLLVGTQRWERETAVREKINEQRDLLRGIDAGTPPLFPKELIEDFLWRVLLKRGVNWNEVIFTTREQYSQIFPRQDVSDAGGLFHVQTGFCVVFLDIYNRNYYLKGLAKIGNHEVLHSDGIRVITYYVDNGQLRFVARRSGLMSTAWVHKAHEEHPKQIVRGNLFEEGLQYWANEAFDLFYDDRHSFSTQKVHDRVGTIPVENARTAFAATFDSLRQLFDAWAEEKMGTVSVHGFVPQVQSAREVLDGEENLKKKIERMMIDNFQWVPFEPFWQKTMEAGHDYKKAIGSKDPVPISLRVYLRILELLADSGIRNRERKVRDFLG